MTERALPDEWTREGAVAFLRDGLAALCDGERSICRVAAERGVFCRGFRRWNDQEFHERWKGTLGVSTHLTRAQMEALADLWQLAEQVQYRARLACDVPASPRAACSGWNEFTNLELQGFCCEMIGQGRLP